MIENDNKPKIIRLGGGGMTVWKPLIRIGNLNIISSPSRPGNRLLFLDKEIPHTEFLSVPINRVKNFFHRS